MRRKINRWLQLVADCLVDLSTNNVKTEFTHGLTYIKSENIYTRGYWDDSSLSNPTLACSITNNELDWVPIFAHEYCHFCQWKEKTSIWEKASKITDIDANKIFKNKPITQTKLNLYLDSLRDLELDCEKRTVQLLKEYKVPIDIKLYIKRANSYIFFYNHIKTYRKWYPSNNRPYEENKIIERCSSRFYKSYDMIPKDVLTAFEEFYPSAKRNNIIT